MRKRRLFEQPLDDMGANRGALPCHLREGPAWRIGSRSLRRHDRKRSAARDSPLRRRCSSAIFCPCATTPGCSSTRSIRCPIVPTAIASTTTPARCWWLVPSMTAGEQRLPEALTARLAAFVQHAWNPDTRRFRNFMSFDRRWLEDSGSEDSHGRTLWALGECARNDASPSRRRWAASLVRRSAADCGELSLAARLGLHAARTGCLLRRRCGGLHAPSDASACLADRLMSLLAAVETKDWVWFEEGLPTTTRACRRP